MKIETVSAETFEHVLPLVAAYQRFYGATPDEARNRAHFGQFLHHHARGIQFVARGEQNAALGFATLYFAFGSVSPGEFGLMNDLYVLPAARGQGCGRALILHCLGYARSRGLSAIEWQTAPDNHTAQRLYNSLPAERSTWYTYTLNTAPAE